MDVFALLGWKVRKLRKEQKLTQEAFAEKSGLYNQRAVSALERAKGNPTLQSIVDAAYGLGVPVTELFSTQGAPERIKNMPDRASKAADDAVVAALEATDRQ